jgi:competence protein CoiA
MLTAIRSDSQKTLAQDANKIDAPFTCPECNKNVILRKGLIKIPHFAHKPPVTCQYGQGESEEHRKCKQAIFNCLVEAGDSVTACEMEKFLGTVRPDIYFERNNYKIAIEVQISNFTMEKIIYRTEQYNRLNINVLWLPIFRKTLSEDCPSLFTPTQWEKWLHVTYYGRVYYWSDNLNVVPVHFGEVRLDNPGWERKKISSYTYKSKKYRIPTHGKLSHILQDFDVTTRREPWGEGKNIFVPPCKIWIDKQKKWWD